MGGALRDDDQRADAPSSTTHSSPLIERLRRAARLAKTARTCRLKSETRMGPLCVFLFKLGPSSRRRGTTCVFDDTTDKGVDSPNLVHVDTRRTDISADRAW